MKRFFVLLMPFLLLFAACGNNIVPETRSPDQRQDKHSASSESPIEIDEKLAEEGRRMNAEFAFSFYKSLLEQQQEETNRLISPLSIFMALSMVYNGADGQTREQMAQAMSAAGLSVEQLNGFNQSVMEQLQREDADVRLGIANSLWGRENVAFRQSFLELIKNAYKGEMASLDFDDPSASKTINTWVSNKTEGKIEHIINDEINPDAILFLINAVYFYGAWASPFNKELTEEGTFYMADGQTSEAPFMVKDAKFAYYEEKGKFQAIALPYADRNLSMYVVLPDAKSSLAELQAGLTAQQWEKWMSELRPAQVELKLPRFTLEYEADLREPLKTLGMVDAFERDGRADFSGLADDETLELFISAIKHKTYMDVFEEGTEAAAVTAIEVSTTSGMQVDGPYEMHVERPFFVAITDRSTGAVLFMGAVDKL